MSTDALGDRMKMYEGLESDRRFMPQLPVLARLDGRSFSRFTKRFEKPFDVNMALTMAETTAYLVEETSALMGYTQSDEITLLWYSQDPKSQIFFDGRIMKMCSVLAAMASVKFNELIPKYLPEKKESLPQFDCRVWTVPTQTEAVNVFVWREQDATKNSIQSAAHQLYSDKELFKKNNKEMQGMLFQKDINWNAYPNFFKRGTYIQRKKILRKFTTEEIEKLPPKHEARKDPNLLVERHCVGVLDLPPVVKVVNREDVFFRGAEPEQNDC